MLPALDMHNYFDFDWPASVLSSAAWMLAGFFILVFSPKALPIMLGGSIIMVGATSWAWHSTTDTSMRSLDYSAVMFCMWMLAGTALATAEPILLVVCLLTGTISTIFVESLPREGIVFTLAVLSAIPLNGTAWYVFVFVILSIFRWASNVHRNRVVSDWLHAVWHVGTAILITIVSLKLLALL